MSEIPYMMVNTRAEFERVRDLAWPVTDRTAATDAEFRSRIAPFESAPTPPEVVEARVVEEVARAIAEAQGVGRTATPLTHRLAVAAVAAYRAAQDGGACGNLSPTLVPGPRLMCGLPVGHGGAHQHDNGDGLPPTRWVVAQDGGAEEAVRRVEALADEWAQDQEADYRAGIGGAINKLAASRRLRAAIAPQAQQ